MARLFKIFRGFTLIELVLTITIVGIISSVSAKVLLTGIDTYALTSNRKDALQHARVGMDRMVAELTSLRQGMITGKTDTRVSFIDSDNLATNFQRTTVNSTLELYRRDDFLAGQVALLDFDYYKLDGTTATWPWEVRRINIELTIQALGGAGSVPLRTEVFMRNYMYTNFR